MKKRTTKKKRTKLVCSTCREATLVRRKVDYDIGALLGLNEVQVKDMPALVCPKCKAVSIEGGLMENAALMIASKILELKDLEPIEIRYLRKLLGYKQDEFAEKLGVARITANRWENEEKTVTGPEAFAIRAHAFFCLRGRSPAIEAVASAFVEQPKVTPPGKKRISLNGSELSIAA